ncbi:hypothetical protein OESDEN_16384 [Oesophagostomum dentatum]|uniref:SSD domain-containing protein n=1 Tax=Oesophagostomum dentatum TaxID=61180 RepID=A0A0B1SG47_OESDE|nr:hypothetical protein OESDEN_16384 [Oesophagostomum dentatum]
MLAMLSATGLLLWCGWKFQSIIVAALFLVLSVGVDDVFIILRAWDRTNADDEVPERLALTLEEAGPSILISSLTNAMAFFIGMTSQTPAVRSFSLYSAIAILICFFYQLIMFSAVLAAGGYPRVPASRRKEAWKEENSGMDSFFSSLTNAMAFFIGMTSQTPAVRSFSLYSAIAILICFFYQLIMFSAVLAAGGYRERNGMQSFLCCRKANPKVSHLSYLRVLLL